MKSCHAHRAASLLTALPVAACLLGCVGAAHADGQSSQADAFVACETEKPPVGGASTMLTYDDLQALVIEYERALRTGRCREAIAALRVFLTTHCPGSVDSLEWKRFSLEFRNVKVALGACAKDSLRAPALKGSLRWLAEYPIADRYEWAYRVARGRRDQIEPIPLWKGNFDYGKVSRTSGVPRRALIRILIDACGRVKQVGVLKSSGDPAFDEAALEAACASIWTPCILLFGDASDVFDGQHPPQPGGRAPAPRAIPVWVSVPYTSTQ